MRSILAAFKCNIIALCEKILISRLSHFFISVISRGFSLLIELDSKVYGIPSRSTAEEMAKYMFEKLTQVGLPVSLIRLWETPTSYCEYTADESL